MPEAWLQSIMGDALPAQSEIALYVGYADDRPVTTGLGVRTGPTIGAYNIATVEAARRRGYGAAMTMRIVDDGAAEGCDVAILQASDVGRPIYERLGFRTVVEYDGYVARPRSGRLPQVGLGATGGSRMRTFQVGVVLPIAQFGPERTTPRWTDLRAMALRAEELGFDTIWTPDELLWRAEGAPPQGVWDGVSMAGAVAAVTSRATVGTWVLSALHRNPGIIAKTAETLDEISGGRFLFGLGAGHEWPGQARAFGLPEDRIFARFDEALEIIVPLLRRGHADFEGEFHAARDLPQAPVGPRPGAIPLLIGGNGPKGQRHAARHADTWSCYIEERAHPDEVVPRLRSFAQICAEIGRDPATVGRSVGVVVNPLQPAGWKAGAISGTPHEIADAIRAFRDAGFTRVEMMPSPGTPEAFEALGEVLARLDAA
jgi:alkanesulfonate monooxygenase SsuD/methylene tetrahydromethanopterin reductase-like flavin-dependent oxidoreductase (luciferase family)